MPAGRPAKRSAPLAAVVFTAALAGAIPAADAGIATTNFNQAFQFTGGEQSLVIPSGIEEIHVIAIGGEGADAGVAQGGQASRVEGDVAVSPGPLFVEVGGTATGPAGGFNGGGADGAGANSGGGGGGMSDIRTIARANPGSVESRLFMAAGGGGAGASGSGGFNGGDGGDGDATPGNDGAELNAPHAAGGKGGERAVFDHPGAGGAGGAPDQGSERLGRRRGNPGARRPGWRRQRRWRRGRRRRRGCRRRGRRRWRRPRHPREYPFPAGGGGGGGGASYSATGGGTITPTAPGTAPSITISYSAPGTTIDGPHGRVESRKPRKRVVFELTSSITTQAFECSLDGADFAPCQNPFSRRLDAGRHKLLVAATDPVTGNSDPTPAKGKVRIVHAP